MGQLSWHVDRRDAVTVVRLSGSLGLPGVPTVRGLLLKCLAECPSGLVVDVAGLTVTRPLLLTVFPAVLSRAAAWPAVPVVLAAPDDALAAALHESTVARTVPIRETVDDAIDAVADGAPLGRLQIHLRPTSAAPAEARRFTRDACAAWHLGAIADEAAIVVTELADNASRHARTPFVVTLAHRGAYLHIAVRDGGPEPARKHTSAPAADAPGVPGKGLRLVDAFATAWGTLPVAGGKTTWATVRVP